MDVINTGFPISAKEKRLAKAKIYDFKQTRQSKYYEQKRVEAIYVEERNTLITVTVYVFYGK